MPQIAYTVSCRFDDEDIMGDWVEWLDGEHLAEVIQCGALAAEVVAFDNELRCEVRFKFKNRKVFDEYQREFAPELQRKGLERFPLELGLQYNRSVGFVVAKFE